MILEVMIMKIQDGSARLDEARELIAEYAARLNRDLSFQNLEAELSDLAGKYTPPAGELLVAVDETNAVVGMVAYHRHSAERCEMKRLYVKPEARGSRLGDRLVGEILRHARKAGYREMVLDTIAPLRAAVALYRKWGFSECAPYYDNPMDDVIYLSKKLSD